MEKLDSAIATLVLKMKEIVTHMMNVKMALIVAHTIVQLLLVLTLRLTVVIPMKIHAMITVMMIAGKVITIVMMKIIIADVNGMEEIVVVAMVIQINTHIVMLVNVWILNFLPQAQLSQPQPQLPVP